MGITVRHRRIPVALLAEFLKQQCEQRVNEYMYEGNGPFPYTLQHYALGEYWPLLRDFLQSDTRQSPFWRILHGAQPIIPFYGAADQEYLGVVDYLPMCIKPIVKMQVNCGEILLMYVCLYYFAR